LARGSARRGCGSPLCCQNNAALIVSPPLYETGLLGIANHQLQCGAIKVDVAPDAFGSPPRMRAVRPQAVELGDERRRELDPVSGGHRAMVPCLNLLVSLSLLRPQRVQLGQQRLIGRFKPQQDVLCLNRSVTITT
jgi:hypothetical protein